MKKAREGGTNLEIVEQIRGCLMNLRLLGMSDSSSGWTSAQELYANQIKIGLTKITESKGEYVPEYGIEPSPGPF